MDMKLHGVGFDAHQVASFSGEAWLQWASIRFFVGDPDQGAKLKEVHAQATELTKPPEKPQKQKDK